MLTLLVSACTKLSFLAANAGAANNYTAATNIAYGPQDRQKLDVYTPKAGPTKNVLVFFYGGRWQTGNKADYKFVADAFTKRGYTVVIPDYRLYPSVKFPTFVEDGAKAVAWTLENYKDANIFIAGHSAGAHIGSLIVSDERYLRALGKDAHAIKGFAGLAGPYAFTPDEPDLIDMFGPPQNYPNMQAATFIDGKEPPMFLLYGADDTVVKPTNHERMMEKITQMGGKARLKIYSGLSHIGVLSALSWLNVKHATVLQDMDEFFSSQHASP